MTGERPRRGGAGLLILTAWALAAAGCQAPSPGADLVIRNARAVTQEGIVLESATLIVNDGRISRVARGRLDVRGRDEIDAGGSTVIPGLVDAHAHLLYREGLDSAADWERFSRDELPDLLEELLRRGVTTVLSTGDYWPEIREVRERVRSGDLLGPRIYAVGPVLTSPGGHPASTLCGESSWCRSHQAREVATEEEARQAVRRLEAEGVDAVKIAVDGGGAGPALPPGLVRAAVDEAHRLGLPVLAHGPANAAGLVPVVEAGIDLLAHPPVTCDREMERLVAALKRRGVPVTTTLGAAAGDGDGETEAAEAGAWSELAQRSRRCLSVLRAAGIPLVLGTDAPARPGGRSVMREMGLLHAAGMSAREVLEAATGVPGRTLPLLARVGVLEPGRYADMVLLEGDPLEDLGAFATIKVVILEGRAVLDKRSR